MNDIGSFSIKKIKCDRKSVVANRDTCFLLQYALDIFSKLLKKVQELGDRGAASPENLGSSFHKNVNYVRIAEKLL